MSERHEQDVPLTVDEMVEHLTECGPRPDATIVMHEPGQIDMSTMESSGWVLTGVEYVGGKRIRHYRIPGHPILDGAK